MQSLRSALTRLLRSSEQIFKLDILYLAKGSVWTTLSFVVGTLASVVTMVAYGNLLSREAFGTYNYLLSLGASLSFLTLSGTSVAVMRAVARGYSNVVPAALRLQLKYNLFAITAVLAAAIYYGYKGNMLFAYSLLILAIAYPTAEAFHIYKQILIGQKRFDVLTKVTSITTLIGTSATVIALFYTKDVLILIAIYAIMSLLPNIFAYWFVAQEFDQSPPDSLQIKEMRRTSFHFTLSGLVGIIATYIDRIVLFQAAGPAALAVYGFAIAGPDRLKSLIKNWGSIALPRLAEKSLTQIREIFYARLSFSLLVGAALALAYLFLAPLLFKIFLPRYLDAIVYSQVSALAIIIAPVTIYIGSIFSSQNMLKATYALNIGGHLGRIVLFVIFGWLWQIWGLIFASILFAVVNAAYSIVIWEIEYRRLSRKL